MRDGGAVELGRAVDGFGLERGGECGVGVGEFVDGAVGVVLQAPGGGEVDDADAVRERMRRPLAGLLVGRGEEEELDAFALKLVPVEGDDAEVVGVGQAGELRVEAGERDGGAFACRRHAAEEDGRRVLRGAGGAGAGARARRRRSR